MKSVVRLSSIPLVLYLPQWVATRFWRLDSEFTAAEFLAKCAAGDHSLEDPAYPLLVVLYTSLSPSCRLTVWSRARVSHMQLRKTSTCVVRAAPRLAS